MFIKRGNLVKHVSRSGKFFYRRKGSPGKQDFIPLLMITGLIIAIVLLIYPPGAGAFLKCGNIRALIGEKLFRMDYQGLLSNSLPGMGSSINVEPGREEGLNLKYPLWRDYPQILLNNELAGLQVLEASKMFIPSADGNNSGISEREAFTRGEETISFLAEKEVSREKPFMSGGEPLLLIYHTHASESFLPVSGKTFASDPDHTVVALGAALAKMLQDDYGIPVLHLQEVFDQPRRDAYQKAGPAVEKILQQNPQIQVVIDLHRDGAPCKITTTDIAGQKTARILFVVGTHHEGWSSNLRFALFLEDFLQGKYPGFSRGILKNIYDSYNQHLHSRSLIVEVGGHENNKEELLGAIPCLAEMLAVTFE